nr:uncharacterized protein LOC126053567 [Helicoverpa armigera]
MKSFIVIALLSTLSVCLGAAVQRSQAPIDIGVLQPGDWVMFSAETRANPLEGFITSITVRTRLHPKYQVNMLRLIDRNPAQGAVISSIGGIGTNEVSFIVTSQPHDGFHISSQLWGQDITAGTGDMRSLEPAECTMTVEKLDSENNGKTVQTYNCNEMIY